MKFLTAVLVFTVASAIALAVLHFFSKDGTSDASGAAPSAEPAPEVKPDPAPAPAAPAPEVKPTPPPAPPPPPPPPDPLWRQVSDEFDRIEREIQTWNPSSTIDVVRTIKYQIVELVRKKGSK